MLSLHSKYLPLIIQEFIEIDYDVRVVVLDGRVLGTMKREVITDGDFRSNISLGAEASNIELTEIEERDALKAAEVVDGRLVGVDFIPAKNREKERPYILEVNSMPGFGGIEKLKKGLVQEILEHFKDRNNWRIDND
jgi:ribosomal protein S6--L-glutamate ligase